MVSTEVAGWVRKMRGVDRLLDHIYPVESN